MLNAESLRPNAKKLSQPSDRFFRGPTACLFFAFSIRLFALSLLTLIL